MGQKQKDAPIPGTETPSLSQQVSAPLRNFKVILQDKTIHSVAGKCSPHATPSCDTVGKKSINNFEVLMMANRRDNVSKTLNLQVFEAISTIPKKQ